MLRISDLLAKFACSKFGQKVYKAFTDPTKEKLYNTILPQVETILSTGCYVWSTAKRKEIDEDRRKLLQIQNIGSGVVGLTISGWANKKIYKVGENIIKDLDTTKIDPKSIRKISSGLRVGLPILTTAVCMRFLIPSAIALYSSKIMDKKRQNKLNVSA